MKGNIRAVIVVAIAAVALVVAGWVVTLVLFKSGEKLNPPRTFPVTTTVQG